VLIEDPLIVIDKHKEWTW